MLAANAAIRMPDPTPMTIRAQPRRRIGDVAGADAEQAFDAAENAADRPANDRSDGPCRAAAHINSVRDAVGNALRLRREWACEQGDGGDGSGCVYDAELHAVTLSLF
jgi:hypothetical protein